MQLATPAGDLPESLALEFPTFKKFFVSLHDHFIPHPRNNYHPHVLSHRMLALLSLLLMTVKIAAISLVAITPAVPVEASSITASTVISLANTARTQGGLNALTQNGLLTNAAQAKADDMLARQYFAHNTPTGETPWTFIKATGYSYLSAGENLAIDFTEAESIQTAWMNSPGHRANIMNANFQEIGIGISKGMFNGHETTIVVQMFGTPISQKVDLPSQPTPVAPAPTPAPAVIPPAPTPAPTTTHAATPNPTPAPASPAPAQAQTPAQPDATPTQPLPIQPTQPQGQPVGTQQMEITSTQTALQGNQLYLNVTAAGPASKLLAVYGTHSVMLDPAENNQWYGYVPIANLDAHSNLLIYAYDINGNEVHQPVAQFSPELNSEQLGAVEGASITVLGKTINAKIWEQRIVLIILAALLTCLVLAIAIRRHIQHVGLVANTAFVAMLAAFMLMV